MRGGDGMERFQAEEEDVEEEAAAAAEEDGEEEDGEEEDGEWHVEGEEEAPVDEVSGSIETPQCSSASIRVCADIRMPSTKLVSPHSNDEGWEGYVMS